MGLAVKLSSNEPREALKMAATASNRSMIQQLMTRLMRSFDVNESDVNNLGTVFGALRKRVTTEEQMIPDADLWIGSIARSLEAKLVTGNSLHLGRVPAWSGRIGLKADLAHFTA